MNALSARPYTLPLRRAWRTAHSAPRARRGFLLRLQAPGLPDGWGDAPRDRASPSQAAQLRADLFRPHPRTAAARHAREQAHLVALARNRRIPLWRLLANHTDHPAPRTGTDLRVNATLPQSSAAQTVRDAVALARRGFQCLKLKTGPAARLEPLLAQLRATLGSRLRLRIDANGSWTRREATTWLPRLARHDLDYIEQPLPPGQYPHWATLKQAGVALAADEELSRPNPERILQRHPPDVVILKPPALGGLRRSLRLAAWAHAHDIDVVVTDSLESAVGRTGALHLARAVGSPRRPQGLASGIWIRRDVYARPPAPRGGRIHVPTQPGLGLGGFA